MKLLDQMIIRVLFEDFWPQGLFWTASVFAILGNANSQVLILLLKIRAASGVVASYAPRKVFLAVYVLVHVTYHI